MNHSQLAQLVCSTSCLGRDAGRLLAGACLVFLAAGCAQPPALLVAPEPTSAVATPADATSADAADCPAERMVIKDVRWFRDSENAWRVVGTIENGWDHAVSKLVTEVEALDASGQVIDHGEDISVYPLNLQPGGQAPYNAWVKREFPGVDHFSVAADECVLAEQLERSHVDVGMDRIAFDEQGRAQVTGELTNPSRETVLVNGLKAVVLDASGAPVAVQEAAVTPRYLAPGEQGPFRVSLDLPSDGAQLVKSYKLYMDVVVSEPKPQLINVAQDVRVTSSSVDDTGRLHLAGQVTNRGSVALTLRLQAALYDSQARRSVVDAANLDTDTPLAPGETRQFDMVDWGPASAQKALALGQPAVELRVEPFQSWAAAPQAVK